MPVTNGGIHEQDSRKINAGDVFLISGINYLLLATKGKVSGSCCGCDLHDLKPKGFICELYDMPCFENQNLVFRIA